jgi:hypothetical protein
VDEGCAGLAGRVGWAGAGVVPLDVAVGDVAGGFGGVGVAVVAGAEEGGVDR